MFHGVFHRNHDANVGHRGKYDWNAMNSQQNQTSLGPNGTRQVYTQSSPYSTSNQPGNSSSYPSGYGPLAQQSGYGSRSSGQQFPYGQSQNYPRGSPLTYSHLEYDQYPGDSHSNSIYNFSRMHPEYGYLPPNDPMFSSGSMMRPHHLGYANNNYNNPQYDAYLFDLMNLSNPGYPNHMAMNQQMSSNPFYSNQMAMNQQMSSNNPFSNQHMSSNPFSNQPMNQQMSSNNSFSNQQSSNQSMSSRDAQDIQINSQQSTHDPISVLPTPPPQSQRVDILEDSTPEALQLAQGLPKSSTSTANANTNASGSANVNASASANANAPQSSSTSSMDWYNKDATTQRTN